ncbi:M23 family metallopeptidase [Myxococcus sp. CA051A]|uniref:M23 family metallopeptidase n=1 Tax=Myxococcus sp. CA051A TaxID=2741739 RepID=UPI00157A7DE1|nr:M23 family metallopeptidase [Myxococcus sp. CA051A]NTX60532.1 M23 family metallopeptidase [Myxococcus sp. CA051A]
MKRYGTTWSIILAVFGVYGLVMFGVSFAGLTGETPMVLSSVLGLLVWAAFVALVIHALRFTLPVAKGSDDKVDESLRWTSRTLLAAAIASLFTAVALAPGAFAACGPTFLANLYHWGGIVGSIAAFAFWFAFPHIARGMLEERAAKVELHRVRNIVLTGAVVYGLIGVFWLGAWLVLRGSIDSGEYPSSTSSPYRLPYPEGDRSWVIQGNNSHLNHNDDEEYAWDFRRQCGTPVLAARAGTVSRVVDTNSGNGGDKPNNRIEVEHGDGTVGRYFHISKGTAKVGVGDTVSQGQQLAEVGNVGNSLTGHIHFDVEKGGDSIPVTFNNVDEDKGIPRTFEGYASTK